jgi:hypothetical protein
VYLRHSTRLKDGKSHTYWRLVRSVRRNGKVVQETVAQLGELDPQGRAKAKALARELMGEPLQRELFAKNSDPDIAIPVRLKDVRVERSRSFGGVWLGLLLWRSLRLDRLFEKVVPVGRESVPWPTVITILAVARLCKPSSELHIAEGAIG